MKKPKNRKIAELESNLPKELENRISSIENGTADLIKPDWEKVMIAAAKIK